MLWLEKRELTPGSSSCALSKAGDEHFQRAYEKQDKEKDKRQLQTFPGDVGRLIGEMNNRNALPPEPKAVTSNQSHSTPV